MSSEDSFVVCYHYPCIDGIFSALSAYVGLKGNKVRFFPLKVNEAQIDLPLNGDETVYMCDFTGPRGFVHDVAARCKKVVVLDHHKTAEELLKVDVPANVELNIDMTRSGAVITRDYFKPDLPEHFGDVYKWVQDVDLWKWQYKPASAEWNAGFSALKLEYDVGKNPHIFEQLLSLKVEDVLEKGRFAVEEEERWVKEQAQRAVVAQIGGKEGRARGWGRCLAVVFPEGPCDGNRSKLGNEVALASQKLAAETTESAAAAEQPSSDADPALLPIGLVVYREADMTDRSLIKVSFRGCGDVDTTVFSQFYQGGGHRLASSCIVPTEHWEEWVAAEEEKKAQVDDEAQQAPGKEEGEGEKEEEEDVEVAVAVA